MTKTLTCKTQTHHHEIGLLNSFKTHLWKFDSVPKTDNYHSHVREFFFTVLHILQEVFQIYFLQAE